MPAGHRSAHVFARNGMEFKRAMIAFIVHRLAQSVGVMLAVAAIAFVLFRFAGDPINMMVADDDTAERRAAVRHELALDRPVIVQFGRFLANASLGDFGTSYRRRVPVSSVIMARLPATLELVAAATLFTFALGIPAGVYAALHRGSWSATLLQTVSLIGISMPTFLIGILLIYVFSVLLGWVPSFGRSGWSSLVLPSVTLGLFQLTLVMRLVRSEMLEVLRTDYIRFARARGLRNRTIYFGHALKSTLVPVITVAGLQIGSMVAFAIVTETVFQWPGLGLLFIQAVADVDIPVMAAYLMLTGLMFVLINLTVDLLYWAVDPRLRIDRSVVSGL
jgi:peptide/nickel transport system permease protein